MKTLKEAQRTAREEVANIIYGMDIAVGGKEYNRILNEIANSSFLDTQTKATWEAAQEACRAELTEQIRRDLQQERKEDAEGMKEAVGLVDKI